MEPVTAPDVWTFREEDWGFRDFCGYAVEASDGRVGKVDAASDLVDATCLVVKTGSRLFGRKVVIPAGVVTHVDDGRERIYVDRLRAEIENAPAFDEMRYHEEPYHRSIERYFAEGSPARAS